MGKIREGNTYVVSPVGGIIRSTIEGIGLVDAAVCAIGVGDVACGVEVGWEEGLSTCLCQDGGGEGQG